MEALPPFLVHLIIIKDVIKRNSLIRGGGLPSSCLSSPIISHRARHLSVSSRDIRTFEVNPFSHTFFLGKIWIVVFGSSGESKVAVFRKKGKEKDLTNYYSTEKESW